MEYTVCKYGDDIDTDVLVADAAANAETNVADDDAEADECDADADAGDDGVTGDDVDNNDGNVDGARFIVLVYRSCCGFCCCCLVTLFDVDGDGEQDENDCVDGYRSGILAPL